MSIKLFEDLKRCKYMKKDYILKPAIKFEIDTYHYYFAFLPTVLFLPWCYRRAGCKGVVDIWWLNFHIAIGTWEYKEKSNG